MKNNKYIRSSTTSLKFSNKEKLLQLRKLVIEYNRLLNEFIKYYWCKNSQDLPKFCFSSDYKQFQSEILNACMLQACGKQALAIVRGTFQKQKQRLFIYNKLLTAGDIDKANKLKKKIDSANISCPVLNKIVPIQLNENTCQIYLDNPNSFDGWLKIKSSRIVDRKFKKLFILVPFKRTKHFNKKFRDGKLLKGVRISLNEISFCFEFQTQYKTKGETIGIDLGISDLYNCSDGQKSGKLNGKDLAQIQKELSRKRKGSKAFSRKQKERENYIRWSIKQLDLSKVSLLRREDLKNIFKYRKTCRFMQAWAYAQIINYLENYCEEQNVSVLPIKPSYTSQRCFQCGWVQKSNRKGKVFKCKGCGYTADADYNASCNISLSLQALPASLRQTKANIKGFYWKKV